MTPTVTEKAEEPSIAAKWRVVALTFRNFICRHQLIGVVSAPGLMNTSILHAFLADQRTAKRLISEKLGVPKDIRASDWATRYPELRKAYDVLPFADVFRIHGYGLEIQIGDFYVDFDYSRDGLADGFDSWRIFLYLMAGRFDNRGSDKHISDRIDSWFDELIRQGRIKKLDNLYYLTNQLANGITPWYAQQELDRPF